MSRHQDVVIDDDEEACPLCIEEFDLYDKHFKPCPCGFQICQFCFNTMKTTYEKSTCPNCRRSYDESTIQYKVPTAEELKADQLNKNKKLAATKRKETEKREVEVSTRRNLAGVRVKQQNLVYVIGLEPNKKDEATLMETLRGKDYFGQYGPIDKIVVSKPKPGVINQGVGVYVTFKNREDAATCIAAVDGSQNSDRTLRAQYGTTKYCSTYLRGDTCQNKNCSFLHENGEEGQYTSLQNEPIESKQKPLPIRSQPTPQPHVDSPATSTAMLRNNSGERVSSRQGSQDGSTLASSVAPWANAPVARTRRASQAASASTASPQLTHTTVVPAVTKKQEKPTIQEPKSVAVTATSSEHSSTPAPKAAAKPQNPVELIAQQLKEAISNNIVFRFDETSLSEETRLIIAALPPLIDPYGGAKRRVMEDRQAEIQAKLEAEQKQRLEEQAKSAAEEALEEDIMATGSLALGGEPEDNPRSSSARGAIGRPSQTPSNLPLDQLSQLGLARSLTPQQRQQLGLISAGGRMSQSASHNTAFELSDFDRRAPQHLSQAQYDQMSSHARHGSRYFNNESNSSGNRFPSTQQQTQQQGFFTSGVQGPPPGLPTAGTPSVSGGGMFAHGQGFTSGGFGPSKDSDNLRARSGTNNAGHDVKRELLLSLQDTSKPLRSPPAQASAPGVLNGMYGQFSGAYQDPNLVKQKRKGGKKQRHTNTSSSGGGVEHLADPSILSARLHQGTSGQGLFGGSQADFTFEPSTKAFEPRAGLHSRVPSYHSPFQSLFGTRTSTPKLPPGLENVQTSASGRSTPQVPPGFENLHGHPSRTDEALETPTVRKDVTTPAIVPVVPAIPAWPRSRQSSVTDLKASRAETAEKAVAQKLIETQPILETAESALVKGEASKSSEPAKLQQSTKIEPIGRKASKKGSKSEVSSNKAFDSMKVALAALEKDKLAPPPSIVAAPSKKEATKETTKEKITIEKESPGVTPAKGQTHDKAKAKVAPREQVEEAVGIGAKDDIKRKPPTKNEIAQVDEEALSKDDLTVETPTVLSRASSPPHVQSTSRRPALRTLNITSEMIAQSTSQNVVPASATTERSAAFSTVAQIRQSSRQPSMSISTTVSRPSTPAISEQLMSHDVSRAGTPPPTSSVVGSAPARQKTKTQQKKDRKEKAKKAVEASESGSVAAAPTPPVAEAVAPVVARQKKQKKQKTTVGTNQPKVTKPVDTAEEEEKEENIDLVEPALTEPDTPKAEEPVAQEAPPTPASLPRPPTPPPAVEPEIRSDDLPSYTLRDFYNDANTIEATSEPGDDPAAKRKELTDLLTNRISPLNKLLSEMVSTGDLAKDHPYFMPQSFTSAPYKLPPDSRRGQAYLDGNGYSSSDVFGMVYLPNKEKRALYNGHAVSVADSGDRKDDLLRRCLITPNGAVLRHLSREESEKVLDLEERRSLYLEEYGELGRMDDLGRLEDDDYVNLEGGFDELTRFGDRHGVCWVVSDSNKTDTKYSRRSMPGNGLEDDYGLGEMPLDVHEFDDQYDDAEDEEDDEEELEGEEMVLEAEGADPIEYEDGSFNYTQANVNLPPLPDVVDMPVAWDPNFNEETYPVRVTPHQAAQHHPMYSSIGPAYEGMDLPLPPQPPISASHAMRNSNTLPPLRHARTEGAKDGTLNLRTLSVEQLEKRLKEKAREVENSRKEMEKAEKQLNKKVKDAGRWRESLFKAVVS